MHFNDFFFISKNLLHVGERDIRKMKVHVFVLCLNCENEVLQLIDFIHSPQAYVNRSLYLSVESACVFRMIDIFKQTEE